MVATQTRREFDVDIDVQTNLDRTKYGTRAMVYNQDSERILPHPSGVYLEKVPIDHLTGFSAFDYKYGSEHGFLKIDILNNTVYDKFSSKEEVLEVMEEEPDWSLLDDATIVSKLPHIGKHFDLVEKLQPRSIEDLADLLALIRPAKVGLIDAYIQNKKLVRRNLYLRPANEESNYFKKSHAISYAYMIVCALSKVTPAVKKIKW